MSRHTNASLLRRLIADAEGLASMTSRDSFPILLRPLAERRKVTSVEFLPLLVDAMLTTHPAGFRILFNSDGENPSELRARYEGESRERMLPPRLRFSLAHEIAHTLFYDLSIGPPKIAATFRSGGGRTELENLERNCNRLAACLLMPTGVLMGAMRRLKGFDPTSLLNVAQQAGVSVEALVRRLNDNGSILTEMGFRGCVVLTKQEGQEVTVTAVARPKHLNIARELRLMKPGERWQLLGRDGASIKPHQLIDLPALTLKVETQYSESDHDYRTAVVECGNPGSVKSHLITFEEV